MNQYNSAIKNNIVNNYKHGYNVLIVEDDDVSYMLLKEILNPYPLKLKRVFDGQEAIDDFQDNKSFYDLILMDIRLPKVNGYDATQRIKEINPTIPIIAVTAYAHSQGIIDCYNSGCDDFIAKPFDINKIIKMVENYLVLRN